MDIIELAIALVVILVGASLFTNGIEWFGRKLNLAEGAVGSVLAAIGTALPETMIPVIAILFGGRGSDPAAAHDVGVGAILGAPFMLSTLALFVTGIAVLAYSRRRKSARQIVVDGRVLGMDLRYFFVGYAIALGSALVPPDLTVLRYAALVLLIGIYAWYVKSHFEADPDVDAEDLAPLRLHRIDRRAHRADPGVPRLRVVNLQVLIALGMIIGGAVVFVQAIEHMASGAGLDPVLLALIIAPIATELPETTNSIIWVGQGKDTLAMGNITGAMVFQSCIPTAIGVVLAADAWTISEASLLGFVSAAITFVSMVVIFWPAMRGRALSGVRLLAGGLFYVVYIGLVLARLSGLL